VPQVEHGLTTFKTGKDSIKVLCPIRFIIVITYLVLQADLSKAKEPRGRDSEDNMKESEHEAAPDSSNSNTKSKAREWAFNESPWGFTTCRWVKSTTRLEERQWAQIHECVQKYIPAKMLMRNALNMGGDQDDVFDLHTCIDLDWYVFLLHPYHHMLKH
jgi:hypothetical protein